MHPLKICAKPSNADNYAAVVISQISLNERIPIMGRCIKRYTPDPDDSRFKSGYIITSIRKMESNDKKKKTNNKRRFKS